MKTLSLQRVKHAKQGTFFTFRGNYTDFWAFVPGTVRIPAKKFKSTFLVSGRWDTATLLEMLEKLPVMAPRTHRVDLEGYDYQRTVYAKRRMYMLSGDKKEPVRVYAKSYPNRIETEVPIR